MKIVMTRLLARVRGRDRRALSEAAGAEAAATTETEVNAGADGLLQMVRALVDKMMEQQKAQKEVQETQQGEMQQMVELRVPWSDINLLTGDGSFQSGFASLAETALNPEFRYLAKATGDCALWR